jgi:hypothetical protein
MINEFKMGDIIEYKREKSQGNSTNLTILWGRRLHELFIVKGDGGTNLTIRIKNSSFTHKDGFYKSSFDLVFRKTDFGGILLLRTEDDEVQ